ncbi:MAG: trypsin-like peptidase domain-containing protein [Clostridia bacterium]|nr:trypsin-like peptidase domain-containing protein [Clostridia bacterium]
MYIYSEKDKKFKRTLIVFAISIIILLTGIKLYQMYSSIDITKYNTVKAKRVLQTVKEKNNEDQTVAEMIENTTDCVVGISKLKDNGNTVFTQNGVSKMGIGSGVIISENGYILTNEHVSGARNSTCYVTMEDGKNYNAKVVWSESNLDLAIIKINMKCINYARLGDSDDIKVGESVYAIGNPIGFEFQKTVTSGIVSALNRTIIFDESNPTSFENNEQSINNSFQKSNGNEIYMSNLIQTDATINPGNSGGPLINNNGEIIGINTVKITSAEGIGFAVPINVIKPILQKLEAEGEFEEASLGIFAYDKNVIPYLNSNIKFDTGIYVAQISLDSAAYRTGLQIGDVITKVDNVALEKMCDLREYIYSKNVGDTVNLTILRNNKEKNIEVRLSKK